jgi:hypothetical protein
MIIHYSYFKSLQLVYLTITCIATIRPWGTPCFSQVDWAEASPFCCIFPAWLQHLGVMSISPHLESKRQRISMFLYTFRCRPFPRWVVCTLFSDWKIYGQYRFWIKLSPSTRLGFMYFFIFHDLIEDDHNLLTYLTVYVSLILLVFICEERFGIAGAIDRLSEHYTKELVNQYILSHS